MFNFSGETSSETRSGLPYKTTAIIRGDLNGKSF